MSKLVSDSKSKAVAGDYLAAGRWQISPAVAWRGVHSKVEAICRPVGTQLGLNILRLADRCLLHNPAPQIGRDGNDVDGFIEMRELDTQLFSHLFWGISQY
jgi:hypothetical protein